MNKLFITTIILISAVTAACIPLSEKTAKHQVPEEHRLFSESWSNPSSVRRYQIRAELATNYPNAAPGLFSRASLADKNGERQAAAKLYRECIEKYPEFMPTLWNYSFFLKGDDQRALREKMMGIDPHFYHGTVVRLLYDLEEESSVEAVERFISRWEDRLGADHYVFNFIRGLNQQYDHKNFEKAEQYYKKALITREGVVNFELWEKYIDLKMVELFDPASMTEGDRIETLRELEDGIKRVGNTDVSEVEKNKFAHKVYKYMGDQIAKINQDFADGFYNKALEFYFSAELAEKVYESLWERMRRNEALTFMEDNAEKYPDNFKVLEGLAHVYSNQQNDKDAEKYYRRAIDKAYLVEDRWETTYYYCDDVLYPAYRIDEAYRLLQPFEKTFKKKAWLYNVLAKNRVLAGDFVQAQRYLDKGFADQEKKGNDPTDYMKNLRKQIEVLIGRTERRLTRESETVVQPLIEAITNVKANWVAVSPDEKYFFGNSGEGGDYSLWDARHFVSLKTFEDFLPVGSHINNKARLRPAFSPDGRYLAYGNTYTTFGGELVIFDSTTGQLITQQVLPQKVLAIAWNLSDANEIAVQTHGGLVLYNVAEKRISAFAPIEKHVAAGGFVWTADGKELAFSEKYSAGKVRVFDAQTLQQTRILDEMFWPHALGATRDGRYLICADNQRKLHVWDRENDWEHRSIWVPALVSNIVAHPEKAQVILNDWGGRDKNQAVLFDVAAMEILANRSVDGSNNNYFYIDAGNKILLPDYDKDELRVLDGETLDLETTYLGESATVDGGCHADSESMRLITWDQEGFHVWDVATGQKLHTWPGEYQAAEAVYDDSSKLIVLVKDKENEKTRVLIFDMAALTQEEVLSLNITVDRWGLQNGVILFAGTPFMPTDSGSAKGFVRLYDLDTWQLLNEVSIPMVTEVRNYEHLYYSRFKDVEISPDNSTVALYTGLGEGWRQDKKVSALTRVYSLVSGKEIRRYERVGGLAFLDNDRLIIGKKRRIEKGAPVFSVSNGAKSEKLADEKYQANIGRHTWLGSTAKFTENNLKISITNDNHMEFRDLVEGKLVLTILAKRDNEWIAYTPGGEFSASKNGIRNVFRQIGKEMVPLASVRDDYERPRIVQQKLAEVISKDKVQLR